MNGFQKCFCVTLYNRDTNLVDFGLVGSGPKVENHNVSFATAADTFGGDAQTVEALVMVAHNF